MGLGSLLAAPIISGSLGLLGDYFAARESSKAQRRATDAEVTLAREQMELQREFAKHGLRWRVEDAAQAGLSPLAAVGSPSVGYTPVSTNIVPDTSMSEFYSRTGQNLSRSAMQMVTAEERQLRELNLERAGLENEWLRTKIDSERSSRGLNPPAFGSGLLPGQGNDGGSRSLPHPARPSQEQGYSPDVAYSQGDELAYPYIPKDLAESYESDPLGSLLWRIRNNLLPYVNPWASRPPSADLPKGYDMWTWSLKGGWKPTKVPAHMREKVLKSIKRRESKWRFGR